MLTKETRIHDFAVDPQRADAPDPKLTLSERHRFKKANPISSKFGG
jgi:hypothetical protein